MHADRAAGELDRPVSTSARHSSQTRNGLPSVSSRIARASSGGTSSEPRRQPDELGHLVAREPGEAQPHDVVPAQVGERLRERLRHVGLGVAEGGEQEHARRPGPDEMAQEVERRGVGPVAVLEHEQRRPAPGDAREHVGDRRVEPVALRVGVGVGRAWTLGGARRQLGQEARESFAPAHAQLVGAHRPRQLAERLDERPVRRVNHGVAGAVEHERAVARGLGGELAHEPALAGAGLAADQDRPAAFPGGARHEQAQPLELGGTPDERERRGDAERTEQVRHDQI